MTDDVAWCEICKKAVQALRTFYDTKDKALLVTLGCSHYLVIHHLSMTTCFREDLNKRRLKILESLPADEEEEALIKADDWQRLGDKGEEG